MKKFIKFLTSLRLTVVLLTLAMVLVFIGTLAQVEQGLYNAQNRFFRSVFVYWSPAGGDLNLPVFPGGYLLGSALIVNLLAAHIARFQFTWKKLGIHLTHGGLILLLLGQLATDIGQVESAMRLHEGESKSYSENQRRSELVVIDPSDSKVDHVISIPEDLLARRKTISHPALPFKLEVRRFVHNSRLARRAPMLATNEPPASEGLGRQLDVTSAPRAISMDERDIPSAVIEIVGPKGSLGTWLVSSFLDEAQPVTVGDKTYQVAMRFERYYKPYSIELLDFTHEKYKGTEIPKNFASRVRVKNPASGESREVLIYMNNPLRYAGATFYQAGFDDRDPTVTILQVVKNPSWLVPYISCSLMGLGLTVQFSSHLIAFARKRRRA